MGDEVVSKLLYMASFNNSSKIAEIDDVASRLMKLTVENTFQSIRFAT